MKRIKEIFDLLDDEKKGCNLFKSYFQIQYLRTLKRITHMDSLKRSQKTCLSNMTRIRMVNFRWKILLGFYYLQIMLQMIQRRVEISYIIKTKYRYHHQKILYKAQSKSYSVIIRDLFSLPFYPVILIHHQLNLSHNCVREAICLIHIDLFLSHLNSIQVIPIDPLSLKYDHLGQQNNEA